MRRTLVIAATALCVAGLAHAQGTGKKYKWDDSSRNSCMEPYAPAVPKADETDLKELVDEVKPEIESFIEDSRAYLKCLSIQMAKAREEGNKERVQQLVKMHNDNVEYQKSVAGEFNATLKTLKEQAGLLPAGEGEQTDKGKAAETDSADASAETEASSEEASEADGSAEKSDGKSGKKAAEDTQE